MFVFHIDYAKHIIHCFFDNYMLSPLLNLVVCLCKEQFTFLLTIFKGLICLNRAYLALV